MKTSSSLWTKVEFNQISGQIIRPQTLDKSQMCSSFKFLFPVGIREHNLRMLHYSYNLTQTFKFPEKLKCVREFLGNVHFWEPIILCCCDLKVTAVSVLF